jgi:FHA domain
VAQTERIRRRIERRLNAAYADGLISHDTHVRRLDDLFTHRVINAHNLVGDLTERTSRRGAVAAVRDALRARRRARAASEVLALDWTGTVEELILGRSQTCDVVVTRPEVSRRHARLLFRDGSWFVHDLGSTNGTTVNGTRVGRCRLEAGDELTIGGHRLEID